MTGRNVTAGTALLAVSLVAGFAGLGGVAAAHADGAPFTVAAEGVSLPAGETFPDGGHVNIHADTEHRDLHFEAKCIARTDAECEGALHDAAQYIGSSFIPWSAFGITAPACVSWVQVAGMPKHFGDAGEPPICLGGTPSATPTPTAPTPDSTGTPTPLPSTPPTSTGTPEPSPSPSPSVTPSPTSTSPATESPRGDAGTDSPRRIGISVSQEGTSAAPARLADTGLPATIWNLGIIMAATTLAGLGLFGIARRSNP